MCEWCAVDPPPAGFRWGEREGGIWNNLSCQPRREIIPGGTQLQIPEALKHYAVAQLLIVRASAGISKRKCSSKLKEMLPVTTVP